MEAKTTPILKKFSKFLQKYEFSDLSKILSGKALALKICTHKVEGLDYHYCKKQCYSFRGFKNITVQIKSA